MNNIFLITKREFLTQVKKKSFIVLTLLAPVMIIAFGAVVGLMFKANESHSIIEVVDKSGLFTNQLKSNDKLVNRFSNKPFASSELIFGPFIIPHKTSISLLSYIKKL